MVRKNEYDNGTWIESEEAAYYGGYRKGRVRVGDVNGPLVAVQAKIADTYFSIPGTITQQGKRKKGFISIEDNTLVFTVSQRNPSAKKALKVLEALPGKVVKIGKNTITMFMPKGSAAKIKNPGVKIKNVAQGFWDSTGFHPIRSSWDYDEARAGEFGDESDIVVKRKPRKQVRVKGLK